ncbi:putative bifunctional diguanylate cyclase/phosphodiesterase [Kineococcus terrestris]|uniref:putative bifunctional diguanylate cyclase/phosphodiesterase n=1 Tax=Kineococcus terrestris TaxID=2044856 RepID=UPI0034DB1B66
MTTGSAWRRLGGRPVWQHLAALVVVPLLATSAVATTTVADRVAELHATGEAVELMRAGAELDELRRAVDGELLPTLTRSATRDPSSFDIGAFGEERGPLNRQAEKEVRSTREATDLVLSAVPATSAASVTARLTQVKLATARSAADQGTASTAALADRYLELSEWLSEVEDRLLARTTAAGLSEDSALAVSDVVVVAGLTQHASRALPTTFTARVLSGDEQVRVRRRAEYAIGAYESMITGVPPLSGARQRVAWYEATSSPQARQLTEALHRESLVPGSLSGPELLRLRNASGARDRDLSALLGEAVDAAEAAIEAERREAARRVSTTVVLCLLVLAGALAAALAQGRWLSRSLRRLADAASRVGEGQLVDVPRGGPREVRTAAATLAGAAAGLQQVREQADALARGDLAGAVRDEPAPGPLGEVVHTSVQQLVRAVQQREQLQGELAHQAAHDALTGLPNRAAAVRLLQSALHRSARRGAAVGLLFIDLDGFKAVNDTSGHAAGDEVLRAVAARLREVVRAGDVVGRLGGDEFVVVAEDVGDVGGLVDLGQRIIDAVRRPVPLPPGAGPGTARVGASVGVAVSRDGGTGDDAGDVLLAEADTAVYRAKARGRGRVEVFDDDLRAELAARSDLEDALRAGLARGELSLHYQPVVAVADGRLLGYEALARWDRPGVGRVPPDVFVAAAEASSLVCDLGRWVLREATAQLARWRADRPASWGAAEPTVAVNVSGRHLVDPRLLDDVDAALAASGLPPSALVLEITETVLVDGPLALEHLRALRARGVEVSIDDFGTGWTSIGQLSTTPADTLKVDRSFTASDDPGCRDLVALVVHAAHTFGLRVVAEGVEEPEQLVWLRSLGCDAAQGYLFSRPLPAAEVAALPAPGALHAGDRHASTAG